MSSVRPGLLLLQVTTAAGLVVTARAVLGHPPPLPWALGCLGGYLALVVVGSVRPRLQMWASLRQPPPDTPALALALDAGPLADHTLEAARQLRLRQAHATFFVLGEHAAEHPDVLLALLKQGHEIGVRGLSDDRWLALRTPARQRRELARAVEAIERACHQRPALLRAPSELVTPRLALVAADLGLELVAADIRADDADPARRLGRLLPAVRRGAVLALTEGPGAVAALPGLLDAAAERGLAVRSVSGLLGG